MLKKGIAAAALMAVTSSVFAGGPEAPPPAYIGGAYVAVGLSRDDVVDSYRQYITTTNSASLTVRDVVTSSATSVGPNLATRIDAGAPGWDGFLSLGYNYVWDNEWSVGLELFGDVSSAHGTQVEASSVDFIGGNVTGINAVSLRAERTFGVSLLPGYYVAPGSLYFLELGYVNSEFKFNGFPRQYPGTFVTPNLGVPSREEDESGFRLGAGTTTQVGDHVAIRQEYVWETYGNVSASTNFGATLSVPLEIGTITASTNLNNRVRVSPNITKYNLAAVYYFARQGNSTDLNSTPAHVGGNFYAGLNGSYDEAYSHATYFSNRTTTNVDGFGITGDTADNVGGLMKITGWNVGLLAGWGWNFTNRWYTGVEVFGNWDDVDGRYNANVGNITTSTTIAGVTTITTDSSLASNLNTRLEKEWDFGAAFIPGYQVSDNALLYARVGYVGGEFEIRNRLSGATLFTPAQNVILSRSREDWLSGLQLGVGVDTLVYENLSLRTEFNINNYGNFNVSTVAGAATGNGVSVVTTQSTRERHLIEDQFNVALIWHFFS